MKEWLRALVFLMLLFSSAAFCAEPFLNQFPELKKQIYVAPRTDFYFGVGISPITILPNRALQTLNAFQLHWRHGIADIEIFSVSLGISSFTKDSYTSSRHFILRTNPKIKIFPFLSVGPLLGYEFVSFPDISVVLTSGGFQTPSQPFSSKGLIYGGSVSEDLNVADGYYLKISELIYQQTYHTDKTGDGWAYQYAEPSLQSDQSPIAPGTAFMIEASLLW